jgi:SAM-dependent methyltransferase
MNTAADSKAIFDYHRNMIFFHGNQATAALGWKDQESQLIRFKVLAQIANLNGCSVLDTGCGHGDLLAYLLPLYPQITYTGLEQIPELLMEANRRYGKLPKCSFMQGDFMSDEIPASDYVIASGSLNYFSSDPDFIYKAIAKLFAQSKLGMGFNLLSSIIPNSLLVAYNQQKILAFCQTISRKALLINDYSEEDFTIFLYR